MSGGSLDYACWKVGDIATRVRSRAATPLHHAFADHIERVGEALHDLEWVWSGDYGKGREEEAIRKVIDPEAEVEVAVENLKKATNDLRAAVDNLLDIHGPTP